jgi:hypothetical protein
MTPNGIHKTLAYLEPPSHHMIYPIISSSKKIANVYLQLQKEGYSNASLPYAHDIQKKKKVQSQKSKENLTPITVSTHSLFGFSDRHHSQAPHLHLRPNQEPVFCSSLSRNHTRSGNIGAAPRSSPSKPQLEGGLVDATFFVRRVWCDATSRADCPVISTSEPRTL